VLQALTLQQLPLDDIMIPAIDQINNLDGLNGALVVSGMYLVVEKE
jgi:hypothetical protein